MINIQKCQVVKSIPEMQGLDKPLFVIDTPIEIHDRHIIFFDENLDGFFKIRVKQVKNEGVAYADEMKFLNSEHLEILRIWLKDENKHQAKTIEMIRLMVNIERKKDPAKKYMKPGSIQGRISEFFRKGVVYKKDTNDKWYTLNLGTAEKAYESAKFLDFEVKKNV